MAGPYLLDVNVLVALFDEAHVHHEEAHDWFSRKSKQGWRTCPITENGVMRVLANPSYPNAPGSFAGLAQALEDFKKSSPFYSFWKDDYSMSQWLVDSGLMVTAGQSTDIYLLVLCQRNKGKLLTFDRRICGALIGEPSESCLEYLPQ